MIKLLKPFFREKNFEILFFSALIYIMFYVINVYYVQYNIYSISNSVKKKKKLKNRHSLHDFIATMYYLFYA